MSKGILIALTGEFAGMRFAIPDSGVMLGRDGILCGVLFSRRSKGISRHHCSVSFGKQPGEFIINDMDSTNGTFLEDGQRVIPNKPVSAQSGDRFYLATPENMFQLIITAD